MENKEKSREEWLRIILENLSFNNVNTTEDVHEKIEYIAGRQYAKKCPKVIYTLEEKFIKNVRKAFVDAGYVDEVRFIKQQEIRIARVGTYYPYQLPQDSDKSMKAVLSGLIYDFVKIINTNTQPDKTYNTDIIQQFVKQLLSGFRFPYISMAQTDMILELYNFYGLKLNQEELDKIESLYREEAKYKDIVSEYIIKDIINKLALNKTSEIQTVVPEVEKTDEAIEKTETEVEKKYSGEINADVANLTIDEKINLIKQKVAELEKLSSQEKELLTALEKIKSEQTQLTEEINSIKL